MIATLSEAVEFYPKDAKTQQALTLIMIRILQNLPSNQPLPQCHSDGIKVQLMLSEEICCSYGEMAFDRGNFAAAVAILSQSVSFHSQSTTLHAMLALACDDAGETKKAQRAHSDLKRLQENQRLQQAQQGQQKDYSSLENGLEVVDFVVSLFG